MLRAALGIEEEKAAGGDGSALREGQLTSSTLSKPRGRHFVSRRGTDFEKKNAAELTDEQGSSMYTVASKKSEKEPGRRK